MKLNVLLAKTDHLASSYKGMLHDFIKFFKGAQGAFKGEQKTYAPRDGVLDESSMRGNILVQTTVSEKMGWFFKYSKDYVDSLFSQEKTNASGEATADLMVDGKSWGILTSLELLRLKSIVEHGDLKAMIELLPVRSDSEIWSECEDSNYGDRNIWESPMLSGVNKTTTKENYILVDPNLEKLKSNERYQPAVAVKNTVIELGDFTRQKFSGEISQLERATILARRTILLTSIIKALKECNEAEAVQSELTSERIFGYLFNSINI